MANTVIGNNITIDGEISGDDTLVVQGTVKGRVALEQVIVEADGAIDGDVEVRSIEIFGQLTGNVNARDRVDIRPDGKVTGDLKAPRIQIAEGARFKGHIDME
jgi:cytoskeletal protein CcmA (bactofilin family)